MFADDARRGEPLATVASGIYPDYSKNHVTNEAMRLLAMLSEPCGLRERIDAMYPRRVHQRDGKTRRSSYRSAHG